MNTLRSTFFLIPIVLVSFSCNRDPQALMQNVRGDANDVVVVMTDKYWEGVPGDLIREKFGKPFVALPQDEPTFDILHVSHEFFDKVYKRQRNIVVAQIGPNYKKGMAVQNDVWAKPQLVISVMAHTQEEFDAYIPEVLDKMVEIIQEKERKRLIETYSNSENFGVKKDLVNKHHVDLTVPKGYNISVDMKDFVWIHSTYRDIQEGIFVYDYPYTDSNTFTKEFLIAKRNEFLKKYVEGTVEGSYMSTEELYPARFTEFTSENGLYTVELRGLWNMKEGTAMGGPFISLTQYDEKRQRIVTVEGFVFAPSEKKRNLLRRVEAIVYTMQFADEKIE